MTDLETKKNVIMNSASEGSLPNLLDGVSIVRGYLDITTGQLRPTTSSDNEYTTDFVDIEGMDLILCTLHFATNPSSRWVKYCCYDDTQTFISPRVNVEKNNLPINNSFVVEPPANAKYVRISWGLVNVQSADIGLYDLTNISRGAEVTVTNQSE